MKSCCLLANKKQNHITRRDLNDNYFSVNFQLFFFVAERSIWKDLRKTIYKPQVMCCFLFVALCIHSVLHKKRPWVIVFLVLLVCIFFKRVMFLRHFCCQKIIARISEPMFCLQNRHRWWLGAKLKTQRISTMLVPWCCLSLPIALCKASTLLWPDLQAGWGGTTSKFPHLVIKDPHLCEKLIPAFDSQTPSSVG